MIGVYTITEIETGKVYVGQSIRIDARWKEHQKTKPLTAYTYKVEQECCIGLLDVMERYFIKKFNTLTPNGLNRACGGWGRFGHIDEKTREKISKSLIGHVAANKGKSPSAETRAKMSEAHTGKKRGPHSDETRAKISASKRRSN